MNIPFHILLGEPDKVLPDFIKSKEIGGVVTDFTPMRTPLTWLENVAKKLPTSVPVCQVLIVFNINSACSTLNWINSSSSSRDWKLSDMSVLNQEYMYKLPCLM